MARASTHGAKESARPTRRLCFASTIVAFHVRHAVGPPKAVSAFDAAGMHDGVVGRFSRN